MKEIQSTGSVSVDNVLLVSKFYHGCFSQYNWISVAVSTTPQKKGNKEKEILWLSQPWAMFSSVLPVNIFIKSFTRIIVWHSWSQISTKSSLCVSGSQILPQGTMIFTIKSGSEADTWSSNGIGTKTQKYNILSICSKAWLKNLMVAHYHMSVCSKNFKSPGISLCYERFTDLVPPSDQ